MFTRSLFNTADIAKQNEILTTVASLIDAGKLRQTSTKNLGAISAANLMEAHALLEGGHVVGKLVLAGWSEAA